MNHYQAPRMLRLFAVSLLLSANAVWPTLAHARPVQETVAAKPNGSLSVEVVATDIELVEGTAAQVTVVGELPDDWKLDVDTSGSRTQVKVTPSPRHSGGQEASLRITVPNGTSVAAKAVSGNVKLQDLSGNVQVTVVSGDVHGQVKSRELEVKTVSGDIVLKSASSRTSLQTVSGDINLDGARGELAIKSVSGDVEVKGASVSRSELASTSGEIQFRGELTSGGPHTFKSHSGDLELWLTKGKPLEVAASSHSGSVEDGFSGSHYEGRSEVTFRVGKGGGPRVELRTFSGDISVRPR